MTKRKTMRPKHKPMRRLNHKTMRPKHIRKHKTVKTRYKKIGGGLTPNVHEEEYNSPLPENPTDNLLQIALRDPSNCLSIGQYAESVKKHFDEFKDLSLVNAKDIKLFSESMYESISLKCPFKKDEYTAYAVLKSSPGDIRSYNLSGNMFYEYFVGKTFINQYVKKFPIFVETYDCYRYTNKYMARKILSSAATSIERSISGKLSEIVERIPHGDLNSPEELKKLFKESCYDADAICLLTQHFDNLTLVESLYNNEYSKYEVDFPFLFYQLYFTLSVLGKKFTHYKLDERNLYVYKPFKGKNYILMRYHSNGTTYEFPSEYIVKAVDYGRNYINNGHTTTREIVNFLTYACKYERSYTTLTNTKSSVYITPRQPNMSHDLKIFAYLNSKKKPDLWKGRIYDGDVFYKKEDGTFENLKGDKSHIRSIHDLRAALETTAFPNYISSVNEKYATWTKAAEMDVYDDGRDYEFKNLLIYPDDKQIKP
jgi:hypothetical protein